MMARLRDHSIEPFRKAFLLCLLGFVGTFAVLLASLAYLQLWRGDNFRLLSENNRIRLEKVRAPRGKILDAAGTVLADTRPCFDVLAIPEEIRDYASLQKSLAAVSPLPESALASQVENLKKQIPFRPTLLWRDASWEAVAFLEANRIRIPGVFVQVSQARLYLPGGLLPPVIGHLGEISRSELESSNYGEYQIGDWIGKTGIEKQWERYLRGRDGGIQVEVDAYGRHVRFLNKKEPVPGKNVVLSLDSRLQQAARDGLEDRAGAVLAMDPRDGRILCYLSQPSFDPNDFIRGISPETWKALRDDPLHPLVDRAIQGLYPLGSVFKIVMAAAALEEDVIKPGEKILCTGSHRVGVREFRCWRTEGHGWMDVHQALVESCDVFFYQMGQRLGIRRIYEYATRFGFGQGTGIGVEGEKRGLVPNPEWKKKSTGSPWYEGETVSLSVGQGALQVTPLQVLVMISAVANGGTLWVPSLVDRVEYPDGRIYLEKEPHARSHVRLSETTLQEIRSALRDVVETSRGTGKRARLECAEVAGKTGTAQVVRQAEPKAAYRTLAKTNWDHAWFACYAPADSPEIAVVVLVENGGHGGEAAAPVARRVLQKYFELTGRAPPEEQRVASYDAASGD